MQALTNKTPQDIYNSIPKDKKDAVYRLLWKDYISEDIENLIESDYKLNKFIVAHKQEAIEYVSHLYIYEGKYDCNLSYWDNLYNLIEQYEYLNKPRK